MVAKVSLGQTLGDEQVSTRGLGKGICFRQRKLMSNGARWQGRVPSGRRVGKTAKTEKGGPSGPAESLDLLLQGKSCRLSVSPVPHLCNRTLPTHSQHTWVCKPQFIQHHGCALAFVKLCPRARDS